MSGHRMIAPGRADGDSIASRWPQLLLGIVWMACVIALLALGVWQVERRAWKLDLIDRVEQRVHADPIPIPAASSWSSINAGDDEYRHVSVRGQFLHDRETLVQATIDEPGYWVVTPLQLAGGDIVLVNRGFVPSERRDPSSRSEGNPPGSVDVIGLLRISERNGHLLRTDDPASDRWYWRDVPAIAAARGLSRVAPFFIDADGAPNPGGWPKGGLTVIAFPNNHLVYALTWFSLAVLLAGAGVRRLYRAGLRKRRRD